MLGVITLAVGRPEMDGNPLSTLGSVTLLVGKPRMGGNPLSVLRTRLDLLHDVKLDIDGCNDTTGGLKLGWDVGGNDDTDGIPHNDNVEG